MTPAPPPHPASPPLEGRDNTRGIRLMVAAMACFIVNDTLVKLVSEALPAGQLIFMRGAMACVLVLLAARWMAVKIEVQALSNRWVMLRAGLDGLATLTYLISLFNLPMATATAINMATPLFITLLAVAWLGARVRPVQALTIAAGFVGVLLIIQPRAEGLNAYAWLCLSATLLNALRELVTQRIARAVPSITITLATAVVVTLMAGVLSAVQGWRTPQLLQCAQLAAAAVFLAAGYHLIVRATRTGELAVVSPFRYSGLLMALVLGWLMWGEVPNALAWAGIVLVIGAGLVLLRRRAA